MKQNFKHNGYSLIELMVVLAIIGILASFALPLYQSYNVKARVNESLDLALVAKANVLEVLHSANSASALHGYKTGYSWAGATKNISDIDIAENSGVITITTTAAAGGGSFLLVPYTNNGTVELALPAPNSKDAAAVGEVQWKCLAKGADTFVGVSVPASALDKKYIPADCN